MNATQEGEGFNEMKEREKTMALLKDKRKFLNAAFHGDLDTIKELTTSGKISLAQHDEIRNSFLNGGTTALILAIENGHSLDIPRFLIESNALDINEKDDDGWTALHWASHNSDLITMNYLIDNGANLNERNNRGWTPLHLAGVCAQSSAINLLLQKGSDPLIQDYNNKTPLIVAREKHRSHAVNAICKHIQRQKLIQSYDKLPIAVFANAFERLESVDSIFHIVSQLPYLFQQEADEGRHVRRQQRKYSVPHLPNCPACQKAKRKRQTDEAAALTRISLQRNNKPRYI